MTRPRYRSHLEDPRYPGRGWSWCGLVSEGTRIVTDTAEADCGHCIRSRAKAEREAATPPEERHLKGAEAAAAAWRAYRALRSAHPDEFDRLLEEAKATIRQQG